MVLWTPPTVLQVALQINVTIDNKILTAKEH